MQYLSIKTKILHRSHPGRPQTITNRQILIPHAGKAQTRVIAPCAINRTSCAGRIRQLILRGRAAIPRATAANRPGRHLPSRAIIAQRVDPSGCRVLHLVKVRRVALIAHIVQPGPAQNAAVIAGLAREAHVVRLR